MARLEEIERRLLNWARWKCGPRIGGLGYASVNLTEWTRDDDEAKAKIPTLDCEAEETDRAVLSLESELRATVEAVYLFGGGMRAKAERLCCSEATIKSRVWRAHRKIADWITEQQHARQRERERVERLQRTRKISKV